MFLYTELQLALEADGRSLVGNSKYYWIKEKRGYQAPLLFYLEYIHKEY